MKKIAEDIDQFLPHGELLRGFINQSTVSKGDLKRILRNRGVFLNSTEKEQMVPFLSTIILSPAEYYNLRECQNTREDNFKKSSSRIEWSSPKSLLESIPSEFPLGEIIANEYSNYNFKNPPSFTAIAGNRNKIKIDFEIVRHDLNKSWYESHNEFAGSLLIEKVDDKEIQIVRTYTSSETEEVGNKLQQFIVRKCKEQKCIEVNRELDKILFSSFNNGNRIIFFWRLTTHLQNHIFTFKDLIDIQFKPDPTTILPSEIDWMNMKEQLILKGKELHNTFFISDKEYHEHLQVWGIEVKYSFNYLGLEGSLNASFEFSNFLKTNGNAEFEVKITAITVPDGLDSREKANKKHQLLEILENEKNNIYKNYMKLLTRQKNELEETQDR